MTEQNRTKNKPLVGEIAEFNVKKCNHTLTGIIVKVGRFRTHLQYKIDGWDVVVKVPNNQLVSYAYIEN